MFAAGRQKGKEGWVFEEVLRNIGQVLGFLLFLLAAVILVGSALMLPTIRSFMKIIEEEEEKK